MSMQSVYVKLRAGEAAALVRLAQDQRRRPSDQAAVLLSEALKQATQGTTQGGQDRAPSIASASAPGAEDT